MATIKGKWKWNDNIRDPWHNHDVRTAIIAFKSGEKSFSTITVTASFINHAIIHYDETEVQSCELIWGDEAIIDCVDTFDETYRVINFGESEQEINEEIYSFITENAHKYNISDKIELIAQNRQKIYDKGVIDGKQAEYDAFWDRYQNNGERYNYQYGAFGGIGWNDETFKPKYPLKSNHCYGMFQGCYITEIKDIDFSGAKNFNHVFAYSEVRKIGLIEIPLTTTMVTTFQGSTKLHTIEKIVISANSTFNNTFQNCSALENITFEGEIGNDIDFQWSTKLTRTSIESIINHLSDDTTGKILTLSDEAVDEAYKFIYVDEKTGEQYEMEGSINYEWTSLVGSKPNWTINLI